MYNYNDYFLEQHHISYNMFNILVIYLEIDESNMYRIYFMKFYSYNDISKLLKYDFNNNICITIMITFLNNIISVVIC